MIVKIKQTKTKVSTKKDQLKNESNRAKVIFRVKLSLCKSDPCAKLMPCKKVFVKKCPFVHVWHLPLYMTRSVSTRTIATLVKTYPIKSYPINFHPISFNPNQFLHVLIPTQSNSHVTLNQHHFCTESNFCTVSVLHN